MTKAKRAPAKALTPKSLGLVDDVKLSASYRNTRKNFKTVSATILGYYVAGGHRGSALTRIAPIYRAEIWIRDGKDNRIMASHEVGPYYNPPQSADEEPDDDGDALAHLAANAIDALKHHARLRVAKAAPATAKKPRRS